MDAGQFNAVMHLVTAAMEETRRAAVISARWGREDISSDLAGIGDVLAAELALLRAQRAEVTLDVRRFRDEPKSR